MSKHNKTVRDRIPEIIQASKKIVTCHMYLIKKLYHS